MTLSIAHLFPRRPAARGIGTSPPPPRSGASLLRPNLASSCDVSVAFLTGSHVSADFTASKAAASP